MDAERPLPDDVPTLQAMVRDLREQLRTQARHFEALIADLRAEVASIKSS